MPMMWVKLDDCSGGSVEVECRKREIKSRQIGPSRAPSIFIDEPLPHPNYIFRSVVGGYVATPRQSD